MVISVNIRTLGLAEAEQYYRRIKRGMNRALDRGLRKSSAILLGEMRREVPKATGGLQESLEVRKGRRLSYSVGSGRKWNRFVEGGRAAGSAAPPITGSRFRSWLSNKGIPRRQWYAVARSIGRKGILPNPYSSRAYNKVSGEMFKVLIEGFSKLVNRKRRGR